MDEELKEGEKLMYFKNSLLDENPTYAFEKAVDSYLLGDKKNALKLMEKIKDNLDFIVEKELKNPNSKFGRRILMKAVLELISSMDCKECFLRLAKRTSTSLEISLALSRLKENEKLITWIRDMLKKEYKLEALEILKDSDSEMQSKFLDELINIAKNEVETPQYISLEILSLFSDKKNVKKIFIDFVSDWDKRVREIAVSALSPYSKEKEVKEALEEALEDERDNTLKFSIKTILKRGKKNE